MESSRDIDKDEKRLSSSLRLFSKEDSFPITKEIERLVNEMVTWSGELTNVKSASKIKEVQAKIKANQDKIAQLARKIKIIETAYNKGKFDEENTRSLIKQLEKSQFYTGARKVIDALNPSTGYLVDITFNDKNELDAVNAIELRHTGSQKRHITPITIIERIIKQALPIGSTDEDVIILLLSKFEIFKLNLNKEDNRCIQAVFDFFKNPKYKNAAGINKLIKIVAHFYNETPLLVTNDNEIKLPNTNQCYLVPILKNNTQKRFHKVEGSFIKALANILDYFEIKLSKEGTLNSLECEQIAYVIYAMLDYLPLPTDKAKGNQKNQTLDSRYYGEPIERLYQAATNHLFFILEAYPSIRQFDIKLTIQIINNFITLLVNGIHDKFLLKITQKGLKDLKKELEPSKQEIKSFTNKGMNKGFINQYKNLNVNEFTNLILTNLKNRSLSYFEMPESLKISEIRLDERADRRITNFQFYAQQILLLSYLYDKLVDVNFENLSKEIQKLLGIDNLQQFNIRFKENLYSMLLENQVSLTSESINLISRPDFFMKSFDNNIKLLIKYESKNDENFNKIVLACLVILCQDNSLIRDPYSNRDDLLNPDSNSIDQSLMTTYESLLQYQGNKKTEKGFDSRHSDAYDLSFTLPNSSGSSKDNSETSDNSSEEGSDKLPSYRRSKSE